jgi:predicted metal-dependent peptidase
MVTETAYSHLASWAAQNHSLASLRFSDQDCGSVVGGVVRRYELPKDDSESPATEVEQQRSARDRVAGAILSTSTDRGSIPLGVLRWAEDYLEPKIDWKKQLVVALRTSLSNIAGRLDYSYLRPSRRQEALRVTGSNVLLATMRQPAPPQVTVVVDTSGSINQDDLRVFIGEIAGIIKAVGFISGVTVIACDGDSYPSQILKRANEVGELRLQGGGGTDMRAGIAAALAGRHKPAVVVVITDGYTPWPDEKPGKCEHFIAVLTDAHQSTQVPGWMRTVIIE